MQVKHGHNLLVQNHIAKLHICKLVHQRQNRLPNFGTTFARPHFILSSVASKPHPPYPLSGSRQLIFCRGAMNTEKFEDHHEGWRTLWLAIAGVMAITLAWNVLMLSLNGISY